MRLVGTKGTIDVLDKWLQITLVDGGTVMAPMDQLYDWIQKLEIYKTEDGMISFG